MLTVALIAHGFLLLVSYSSIVEPSGVQARLQRFFSWYLHPLHLNVDGRPVFLLHQREDAAAAQFQVRAIPTDSSEDLSNETGWQPVPAVGWVGGERRKRYQRWAATTGRLAQQQQVGLAGLLARNAVINEDARAIRLVFLSNPLTEQLPYFESELYRAAIVRESDHIRFVHLNEARQNAVASESAEGRDRRTKKDKDAMTDRETDSLQRSLPESDR